MIAPHGMPLQPGQCVDVALTQDGRLTWWGGRAVHWEAGLLWIALQAEPVAPVLPPGEPSVLIDSARPLDARYWIRGEVVTTRPGAPMLGVKVLEISRIQRRHAFRVPLLMQAEDAVRLTPEGQEEPLELAVHNLSADGLLATTSVPLSIGDRLRAGLRLVQPGAPVEMTARVVRTVETSRLSKAPCAVGLQFVEAPPRVHQMLVRLTLAAQAQLLRRERSDA